MRTLLVATLLLICSPSHGQYLSVYSLSAGTATKSGQTYTATGTDQSAIVVTNGGVLTLTSSAIKTSGNTTSQDSSSFYGLNAGVIANGGGTISMTDCSVTTTGSGANGVFATGSGSSITLNADTIVCAADGGHGVDATLTGTMSLTDVIITTAGAHGAAIATDRGGGTITVLRGSATASGTDSPGIYSTGTISVSDATLVATGAEAAVIEGANSITLTKTQLSAARGTRDRGLMIYQSMSGDAQGKRGVFAMTGGSITWPSSTGPVMFVTNTTAVITLKGVSISSSSGAPLIKAAADQWGTSGSNGGTVILTADSMSLAGAMVCDNVSSITATLQNGASYSGAINTTNSANSVQLTIDASSSWTVTANSYISVLQDDAGVSGSSITNIIGNGYIVYYDQSLSANSSLGGKRYSLVNGGELRPKSATSVNESGAVTPTTWGLEQNYPNPFNPVTTIRYQLAAAGRVSVRVYDVLGREVATIVDRQQSAGIHSATFDAAALPSGVYLYRLQVGSISLVKKMTVLR